MFWSSFLVRVMYITLAHAYRIRPFQDHFGFGWEMGRIARALATGYGYADPFAGHTGATAWVPPLYPLLLAGIFRLFGVYTAASAWIILTVNSVFSAATAVFIYRIAARCYNRRIAMWSAWIWAVYPAAMQYAVHWVWEMSLTTMLFAWMLVLALEMRGIGNETREKIRQTTGQWLLFGALWGLIALSNSTLLLFLPVCGIWLLQGTSSVKCGLKDAVLAALVFLAFLVPWMWRNRIALHAFVPIRSNLGVELWAWNHTGANGISLGAPIQPSLGDPSFIPYARMGEIAYSKYRGAIAKQWIRTHPKEFALLSLRRFYFYWVSVPHPLDHHPLVEYGRELDYCFASLTGLMGLGLSLKRRVPGAQLFAWAFLLLPLIYYFVSVAARFRHPLEPLIVIFTVYLFQSATRRGSSFAGRSVS
uniref:Glycosyltransferase RgtA/B/C/D-like domain-containing protein n=1 Tax=Paracidobacterium acidisoli TaxID=2303751 RepID=A0A372IIU6_9BACT